MFIFIKLIIWLTKKIKILISKKDNHVINHKFKMLSVVTIVLSETFAFWLLAMFDFNVNMQNMELHYKLEVIRNRTMCECNCITIIFPEKHMIFQMANYPLIDSMSKYNHLKF